MAERHIDDIPVNWEWIAAETQPAGLQIDFEDDRPIDTEPLLTALADGRQASKDRVRSD